MKRNIIIFGTLVIVIGLFIGLSAHKKSSDIVIKVGTLPVFHAVPLYIAQENGYFDEEHVKVEIVTFDAPQLIINAVAQGAVDISSTNGATGISAIAEDKAPGTLKWYGFAGGTKNVRNDAYLVRSDSSIKNISELSGKKIGILAGIQWKTISAKLASINGITNAEYVELSPQTHLQALEGKSVDAVLTLEPNPSIAITHNTAHILLDNPTQALSAPFLPGAGVVRTQFLSEHPDEFARYMHAYQKAVDFMNAHPDESRMIAAKAFHLDAEVAKNMQLPYVVLAGNMTEDDRGAVERFIQIFKDAGIISQAFDIQEHIASYK